jgi:riboflavin biosynthesis pyrimidine reductase
MEATSPALARFAAEHSFQVHLDDEGPAPDDPLLRVYGGPLGIRRRVPSVVANFVSSADGVTAFGSGGGLGAGAVSLHSAADRYVMALLRCAADCVLIGAGTLRDDTRHQWTPATVMPDLAADLGAHRRRLTGQAGPPALAVVTAGGHLPEGHPALERPDATVLVITTQQGAHHLPQMHRSVRVAVVAAADGISASAILDAVRLQLGASTVLCEGGPSLVGSLIAAGRIDELFLTVAPHLAGRSEAAIRPGIVSGVAFAPGATPRLALRSLRQSGEHLFLRYAVPVTSGEAPAS